MPDIERVNPNPRLVALVDYAVAEITAKLLYRDDYDAWMEWAKAWRAGERAPGRCTRVAHKCFEKKNAVGHALGQIAWSAKEACYSAPTSGWLVIRYIADAMIAFGIAYPERLALDSSDTALTS